MRPRVGMIANEQPGSLKSEFRLPSAPKDSQVHHYSVECTPLMQLVLF